MTRVVLALGSNLGSRAGNLRSAILRLRDEAVTVTAVSSTWETAPVPADQPAFLNLVLTAETELEPAPLLAAVKRIERALGRRPQRVWGPRPIDIDILFYGSQSVETDSLTIPHKLLPARSFVLAPLAEVLPGPLPVLGESALDLLARVEPGGPHPGRSHRRRVFPRLMGHNRPVDYTRALDYLLSFNDMERGFMRQSSTNPVMSLSSMRSLLSRLNNPHLGRPTVHVTGSKGKGSTASMIASIIEQNGQVPALFTSPHLHSFTERIAIGGESVSTEEFSAGMTAIQPVIDAEQESVHGAVSTFGILTALFFWLVRAQVQKVDWQVVEVGLGGTFDTTNVFSETDIVVITPISLEHTAILGKTCAEIAKDKAGLVKPGSHVILARQRDPAVLEVVRARCVEQGATLVDVAAHYEAEPLEKFVFGQSFLVHGPGGTKELRTPMLGRHQVDNAVTAVAAIEAMRERGHAVSERALFDGIARTRVPGRMEVMGQKPLIVADGAHNGESAAALADTLRNYFEWKKCYFVLGTAQDKDVQAIAYQLAKYAELICCCRYNNPRAMDPYAMIQEVGFMGPPAVADDSVIAAIDTALSHATENDIICITGSLYVVAEAREYLLGESVTRA